MPKLNNRLLLIVVCLILSSHCLTFASTLIKNETAVTSGELDTTGSVNLPENYTSEQVEAILARLSDDQVRRLLIEELQKSASDLNVTSQSDKKIGMLSGFYRSLEDGTGLAYKRMIDVTSNIKSIPADIASALQKLTEKGLYGALIMLVIFAVGFGAEVLFRRLTVNFRRKLASVPTMDGFLKFWSAVLKFVPDLLGIIIFALMSLFLFWVFYGASSSLIRLMFVHFLIAIIISRLVSAISQMMCEPSFAKLRFIPLSDRASLYLHKNIVRLTWITVVGLLISGLFYRMGIKYDSYITLLMATGTIVILMLAGMVWANRTPVAQAILSTNLESSAGRSWFAEQFAAIWHILALFYLLLILTLGTGRLIIVGPTYDGAFIISILIVPIYLAIDRMAQWLIGVTASTIHDYRKETADEENEKREDADAKADVETEEGRREKRYIFIAQRIVRIFIIFSLAFWLLEIWDIGIPFGKSLIRAAFSIMIILALAHITWGFTINLIDRKLKESEPIAEEADSGEESEWGAAVLDRSQTILPLLRKFIGSVLVIMVTMIILSSIGVDIVPLLAGAGVIGLAIGFGAQKLVADVLSGVFFLIDDSFRIGEYLQTGGLTGSVEKITLRNVWLRHHRGMIQIVPFSDLGSITNYMRGGMVVKFNLEFPYDTNIDKVRKIIKKVGKKMLKDEEFGSNFIKQIKSQGVRDISNSVMTIRVKFTAQPGTHFVIRREAYRRITEALTDAGINYAHKKVIVDIAQPEPPKDQSIDAPSKGTQGQAKSPDMDLNQTLKAGAAAAIETIIDEQKKEEQQQKK